MILSSQSGQPLGLNPLEHGSEKRFPALVTDLVDQRRHLHEIFGDFGVGAGGCRTSVLETQADGVDHAFNSQKATLDGAEPGAGIILKWPRREAARTGRNRQQGPSAEKKASMFSLNHLVRQP